MQGLKSGPETYTLQSVAMAVSSGSTGGWGMHPPSDQEKFFAAKMQERRFSMITKCTGL
jgi:hypothetical protein